MKALLFLILLFPIQEQNSNLENCDIQELVFRLQRERIRKPFSGRHTRGKAILKAMLKKADQAAPAIPLLIEALNHSFDGRLKPQAMAVLEAMGDTGTQALNDAAASIVKQLVKDPHGTGALLYNLGEPGYEALMLKVRSSSPEWRVAGVQGIRVFSHKKEEIVPEIAPFLTREDPALQRAVLFTLGAMTPISLPILLNHFKHPDHMTRRIAVEAVMQSIDPCPQTSRNMAPWRDSKPLEECGETITYLINNGLFELAEALKDPSEEIRCFAALALFKLGPHGSRVENQVEDASQDPSSLVRFWAENALKQIKVRNWPLMRKLSQQLGASAKPLPRNEAKLLLSQVKTGTTWEYDSFGNRVIDTTKEDPRWEAALKLIQHQLDTLEVNELELLQKALDRRLNVLVRMLDREWGFGKPVQKMLTSLGPAALPALEFDYLRCLRFPMGDPTYLELIWVLEQNKEMALPILVKGLEHWTVYGQYHAVRAIGKLERLGLPAAPAILSAWRYENHDYWEDPSHGLVLSKMGPGVLPWLKSALKDDHFQVRVRACRNLRQMAHQAEALTPDLEELLKDPFREVAIEAARALLKVTKNPQTLQRALETLQQ